VPRSTGRGGDAAHGTHGRGGRSRCLTCRPHASAFARRREASRYSVLTTGDTTRPPCPHEISKRLQDVRLGAHPKHAPAHVTGVDGGAIRVVLHFGPTRRGPEACACIDRDRTRFFADARHVESGVILGNDDERLGENRAGGLAVRVRSSRADERIVVLRERPTWADVPPYGTSASDDRSGGEQHDQDRSRSIHVALRPPWRGSP
jgi:hypothetical protein